MEEAEDKRKDKHRKMEEERETMRQGIRDKVRLAKVWRVFIINNNDNGCICSAPVSG